MKIKYNISATIEGNLDELLTAKVPDMPTMEEVVKVMEDLAFIAETVAHLRGMEPTILPHTTAARKLLARLKVQP